MDRSNFGSNRYIQSYDRDKQQKFHQNFRKEFDQIYYRRQAPTIQNFQRDLRNRWRQVLEQLRTDQIVQNDIERFQIVEKKIPSKRLQLLTRQYILKHRLIWVENQDHINQLKQQVNLIQKQLAELSCLYINKCTDFPNIPSDNQYRLFFIGRRLTSSPFIDLLKCIKNKTNWLKVLQIVINQLQNTKKLSPQIKAKMFGQFSKNKKKFVFVYIIFSLGDNCETLGPILQRDIKLGKRQNIDWNFSQQQKKWLFRGRGDAKWRLFGYNITDKCIANQNQLP